MPIPPMEHPRYKPWSEEGLKKQSVILPGTEHTERIRINSRLIPKKDSSNNINDYLITDFTEFKTYHQYFRTFYDAWKSASLKYSENNCLGSIDPLSVGSKGGIKYNWLTYADVARKVDLFGAALKFFCGVPLGKNGYNVGIYAGNSYRWTIAGLTANCFNFCLVPLYDTLGPDALRHISNLCQFEVVIVADKKQAKKLLAEVHNHEKGHKLQHVIVFNSTEAERATGEFNFDFGPKMHFFDEMIETIEKDPAYKKIAHSPPSENCLFTICFTSGTTGNPKGVQLTHKAWIANMTSIMFVINFRETERWFSYLPLAHVFERICQSSCLMNGGSIGFSSGNRATLIEELGAMKPTFFGGVPRVWNLFYSRLMSVVNGPSPVMSRLARWGLKKKLIKVREHTNNRNSLIDRIIFKGLFSRLGGSVQMAVTGAAPIKNDVLNTLRGALGVYIFEAYGQTECCAGATCTNFNDHTSCVGPPLPCNAIKLADVPDMGYLSKNDQGEICVKGTNVMSGYFKNPEASFETLDKKGWLHTGDIGEWTKSGCLKIIDRKKHIFKTSLGEYIAPEKIENLYNTHQAVSQCFVYGDGLKSKLVAIIVIDEQSGNFLNWVAKNVNLEENLKDEVKKACEANKKEPGTLTNFGLSYIVDKKQVQNQLMRELQTMGLKEGMKSFEMIKNVRLMTEMMSVDNGLLTPTFKAKRSLIQKYYKISIKEMYEEMTD